MKKILVILSITLMSISSFASSPWKIDENVIASFQSHFPNARQILWLEFDESYEVYFLDNGIQVNIVYQKDQSLVRITRYYTETNLPYDIHYILEKELPDKKIFGITEVSTISQPGSQISKVYYLTMEDENKWYKIEMYSDGSFRITDKYRKAPRG
jgi:hypothetical protein